MIVETVCSVGGYLLVLEAVVDYHLSVVVLEGGEGLGVCLDIKRVGGLGEGYILGSES